MERETSNNYNDVSIKLGRILNQSLILLGIKLQALNIRTFSAQVVTINTDLNFLILKIIRLSSLKAIFSPGAVYLINISQQMHHLNK